MGILVRGLAAVGIVACLAGISAGAVPEGVAGNWPVFRGWGGNGRVTGEVVKTWDGKKGENILWKTKTGLPGNSSPVVWGDKVFITGGDETNHEVYCYGAADGKLLWTGKVPREGMDKVEMPDEPEELPPEPGEPEPEMRTSGAGWAACTPAVDGKNVYAIFASGEIAAFDFSGKKIWQKYLGKPDSAYGYSSSLTVTGGNVIVQWDMGENEKAAASSLVAFDGATGKEAWRTKRPGANAWGSPVVSADGKWIVTTGSPWVSAYEAATGAETWRARLFDNDVSCTPCVIGDVAVVANDHAVMAAMKMDGKGDVTKDGPIWQGEDGLPDVVSPTSDGKYIWTITANATLFCFDFKTGEKVYETELKGSVMASPVIVGDELWITDLRGMTRFVTIGKEYKERGRATMGEAVRATPAFAGGKMFVRTMKGLVCVGTK